MNMRIQVIGRPGAEPTDEEVAAVIAALSLDQPEGTAPEAAPASGWIAAARLEGQGFVANRATKLSWNSIERLRRAGRGKSGITGL